MDTSLITAIAIALKIVVLLAVSLGVVPIMVWFERRGAGWFQGRTGPNRVGPFGLLQPLADVVKFIFKESWIPDHANKFFYMFAPIVALVAPMAALATIPFGSYVIFGDMTFPLQLVQADSGVIFLLAFAGLEVYPLILAGWSSNNKYSVLGALRGSAQVISYEIAMGLALLSMILFYGTFNLQEISDLQSGTILGFIPAWGAFYNPIAALVFFIAIFAETNRLPFDLPEGESEIVAGYHLEYGAMKFATFFMAEYAAMIMASALFSILFLGGYSLLPGMQSIIDIIVAQFGFVEMGTQNVTALFQFLAIASKVAVMMFIFVWVRWSLPRFRFDQLMDLGWKYLFPISLANIVFAACVVWLIN